MPRAYIRESTNSKPNFPWTERYVTQVMEMYRKGGVEADESTNLFFVDVHDVVENNVEKSICDRFTPYARASIELLKRKLLSAK